MVRDLGVFLDSKMTFEKHSDDIIDNGYKNLGFVLRVSNIFMDISYIKALYYCYVRNVLKYCSAVWNQHCKTYINEI